MTFNGKFQSANMAVVGGANFFFSRVLRDSISHFSVGPSVRPSVGPSQNCFKGFLKRFFMFLNVKKELCGVDSHFKYLFEKKKLFVCLSA